MEKELIEHTVEIDNYITATLRIPKVLDAMELKALMVKANKLFNLAEIEILDRKPAGRPVGSISKTPVKKHYGWTKQEETMLMEKIKAGIPTSTIAKEINKSPQAVYNKVSKLKKGITSKKVSTRELSENEEKSIMDVYKTMTLNARRKLAESMGLKVNQLNRRVWYWKNKKYR